MSSADRQLATMGMVRIRPREIGLSQENAFQSDDQYVWQPSPEIEHELPPGFEIVFDILSGAGQSRRLVPTGGIGTFIVLSSFAGNALLAQRPDFTRDHRFTYDIARWVYRLAPRLREYYSRGFTREADLYVPKADRLGNAHVLPDELSSDELGEGRRWTPIELVDRGRKNAQERGSTNPDTATCIQFGLLEAARRSSLDLTRMHQDEALNIIRLGLFDLSAAANCATEGQIEQVTARFLAILERHLDDDTETFDRWLFEDLDNIVHAIAKKKHPGGKIQRQVVRQALLELVFRAYRYVGDCIHLLMEDFRKGLPDSLSDEERSIFDRVYSVQPLLGGLPLILLHDRFDFLKAAILQILAEPRDEAHLGVLLRLMQYYGEMVSKKREADRSYKRQQLGGQATPLTAEHADDLAAEQKDEPLQAVAEKLREKRSASCPCGTTASWRAELQTEKSTSEEVVFLDICETCDQREELRIAGAELRSIAEELRSDEFA